MSVTLNCRSFFAEASDFEVSFSFLEKTGLVTQNLKKIYSSKEYYDADEPYTLELKDTPPILKRLRDCGVINLQQGDLSLMRVTDSGALLYVANALGDGLVFIPMHNILSIHTLTDKQLREAQESA